MSHRSTRGHKQVGVIGNDAMLLVQFKRHVETMTELGEILQRATQEGDVAADGTAACKAGDSLGHHGLEDGGSDVCGSRALIEQGLHIGLGKDATAAGDGIDGRGLLGKLV